MDYNLPRWLKNDLGLVHMSEADLNGLMYHPRHGGLCRRLVKFLAESTLCRLRYPTVYAKEELDQAVQELESKSEALHAKTLELGEHLKETENKQRELDFLKEKLNYVEGIERLYKESLDKLENIMNRPNYNLEQTCQNVRTFSATYLENNDLELLFSSDLKELSQKMTDDGQALSSSQFSNLAKRQQMQQVEHEYKDLLDKTDVMHRAISVVLGEIIRKMSQLDYDQIQRRERPNVEDLIAFKMPECEKIVVEANSEERELRARNDKLLEQTNKLEQQVVELADQYRTRRNEITQKYKTELQEDLFLIQTLQSLE